MAEAGKTVAVKIRADTSQLTQSLRQASSMTKMFGAELTGVNKGMASLLDTSKKTSGVFGGALSGGLTTTVKNLGALTQEVEKSNGVWQRFTSGQLGQLNSMLLKVGGLGIALKVAGDYLKGAFDRSKTDPALEGLDRLRRATEGWTDSWERAIDRIIGKIANAAANHFLIENDTHSNYAATRNRANARDMAMADMSRLGFRWSGQTSPQQLATLRLLEQQRLRQLDQRTADAWGSQFGGDEEVAQIVNGPAARTGGGGGRGGSVVAAPTWNARTIAQSFGRWGSGSMDLSMPGIIGAHDPSGGFQGFGAALGASGPGGGQISKMLEGAAAKMNEVSEASQQMLGVLSSGLSAGIDALISGQEGAGKAALRASAMALRGLAVEYGVRALAATAMFNFPQAAGLAAAAAAAGAGSALLAGLAGGGGGGGAAVPAPSFAAVPRGPAGPSNVTYNVTGSFAGSPGRAYEALQRGAVPAAAAGTGSVRSYQIESFD